MGFWYHVSRTFEALAQAVIDSVSAASSASETIEQIRVNIYDYPPIDDRHKRNSILR